MTAEEYGALEPVHAAHVEGDELAMDRTEEWWRNRVFDGLGGEPYVYAREDDAGETRAYVVYRFEDADDGTRLSVSELAYADPQARRTLFRFLANHDSQVETVRVYGRPDASVLDLVDDPSHVDFEVGHGPMVRLVDVSEAIEVLRYPGVAGEFDVSVSDPFADWNDRRFRVAVDDGDTTCDPVSETARAGDSTPDVAAPIGVLSQVHVGYHSVEDAER